MADETARVFHSHRNAQGYAEPVDGAAEDCPRCTPPSFEGDATQLCFALHKNGGLFTRDGRPVWAERKLWEGLPDAVQVIPIKGAPPVGSVPLNTDHTGPDLIDLMVEAAQQLVNRPKHERELLRRAAAIIDPTMPTAPYETRLDWLAKYREVIS